MSSQFYAPLGTEARHALEERIRLLKQAELENRHREAAMQGCTFHPNIIASGQKRSTDEGNLPDENEAASKSVFDRLAWQAHIHEERRIMREQQQQRAEEAQLKAGFKPRINKSSSVRREANALNSVPVEDRLLHYGRATDLSNQMQRDKKEREEAMQTSRVHQQRERADPADRRKAMEDFEERNAKLLYERRLKQDLSDEANMSSFQPKVCSTSSALDRHAQYRRQESVRNGKERSLYLYEKAMDKIKEKSEQQSTLQDNSDLYHRPRTNPLSDEWIERGAHKKLFQQDFVSRQALYQQAKEEERHLQAEHLKQQELANNNASFQSTSPTAPISRVSQDMIEEQVKRLYYTGKDNAAATKERLARQYTADECPFRPQISPGSQYVLRKMEHREKDFVKRLASTTKNASNGGPDDSPRTEFYESTPRARANSEGGATTVPERVATTTREDVELFYRRQMEAIQEREDRIKLLKQKELVEALTECTFRPRTNAGAPAATAPSPRAEGSPVVVSGVQQFLLRQQEAKRLREEKEARNEQIARGNVKPRSRGGPTTFSPFTLQTDQRSSYRSRSENPVRAPAPSANTDADIEESAVIIDDGGSSALSGFTQAKSASAPEVILVEMDANMARRSPRKGALPANTNKSKADGRDASPQGRAYSALKKNDSSSTRKKKKARSVSFTGVRQSSQERQHPYADPYNITSLLATLRN